MTKLTIIIACSVIALFLISGCVGPGAEVHDCGSDFECFKTYAANCGRAKVLIDTRTKVLIDTTTVAQIVRVLSGGPSMKVYAEIKGGTLETCTAYYRYDEIQVPPDTPLWVTEFMQNITGKDMECTMPASQMLTMTDFSGGLETLFTLCRGPARDMIYKWYAPLTGRSPGIHRAQKSIVVTSCVPYANPAKIDITNTGELVISETTFAVLYVDNRTQVNGDAVAKLRASLAVGDSATLSVTNATGGPYNLTSFKQYLLRTAGMADAQFAC